MTISKFKAAMLLHSYVIIYNRVALKANKVAIIVKESDPRKTTELTHRNRLSMYRMFKSKADNLLIRINHLKSIIND